MTVPTPFGLGGLQSPPDDRDFQLSKLLTAQEAAVILPPSYDVPKLPPIYDQGNSPMCVAYSDATEQAAFDLIDQGHNYLWDFSYFFRLIGGGPNGAILRNGLDRRLWRGYPLKPAGSGNSASSHRIAAYYAVPRTQIDVQRAIFTRGVCILGIPWFNSWFYPDEGGFLPSPDYQVGGHAIAIIGYSPSAAHLQNSWGTGWSVDGRCWMPWHYLLSAGWEVWKAVDVIDPKAATATMATATAPTGITTTIVAPV
jgi:hypothetical protein